jgi:hypothetical protein
MYNGQYLHMPKNHLDWRQNQQIFRPDAHFQQMHPDMAPQQFQNFETAQMNFQGNYIQPQHPMTDHFMTVIRGLQHQINHLQQNQT